MWPFVLSKSISCGTCNQKTGDRLTETDQKLSSYQAILCLTLIPEKLVLLRCPLRVSKIVEVVYVKSSSLNSPSTPASAAALEFKVEFSFKSENSEMVPYLSVQGI